jgi:conjugal transfer pilus assembly protein TraF
MFYVPRIKKPLAATVAALLLSVPFSVSAKMQGFYKEGEEGWFWYQDPAPVEEPEEKEPEKKEEPSVVVMEAPKDAPPPEEVEPKGPPALSAAWFRENLQTYMDRAIDNPTEENVEVYYLLQRVMMDKAEKFSDVAGRVVVGDKLLDEINRRSLDMGTSRSQERVARAESKKMLKKIVQSAGITFFYSSGCNLCEEQARVLNDFQKREGIEILPVSIDGQPLKSGIFADSSRVDSGQAELLGVEPGSPGLFLAVPPDQWIPLAFGVVNQDQLTERLIMSAQEAGIITDEEYQRTRPVAGKPVLATSMDEVEELPEDPKEIIELLRRLENK